MSCFATQLQAKIRRMCTTNIYTSFNLVVLLIYITEETQDRKERQSRKVAKIKSCQVDFIYKKSYALMNIAVTNW